MRLLTSVTAALFLLLLSACVPGANAIAPPTFAVVADGSGLVRLEPPGVGRGAAVFRLELRVTNPNPVPVELAALDGEFFLAGRSVARSRFPGGVALAANGTSRWTIEVEAPLAEAPYLATQMARLLAGEAVPYRLDGTATLEVFGVAQRLPALTVARGELRPPGALPLPEVRFDAAASGVRLEGLRAMVEVGLAIRNDAPFGYRVRGPELQLLAEGRPLGRASLPGTAVPAFGDAAATLRVEANLVDLGAAATALVRGGGALRVAVEGDLVFAIPGVAEVSRGLAGVAGPVR